MLYTQIQTRLRSIFNEDTRKHTLVPSKVWQIISEYDECEDVDIESILNSTVSAHAHMLKVSDEECAKYFRLKEIERDDYEDE